MRLYVCAYEHMVVRMYVCALVCASRYHFSRASYQKKIKNKKDETIVFVRFQPGRLGNIANKNYSFGKVSDRERSMEKTRNITKAEHVLCFFRCFCSEALQKLWCY